MLNKILLIDDDQYILEMLTDVLTHEGYAVHPYQYTQDIFKLIEENRPDLVIVDYLMNDLNGGEICSSLKRNLLTKSIPVIIISAYERVINSLGNYGCDKFIAKPLDMPLFLSYINKMIRKR